VILERQLPRMDVSGLRLYHERTVLIAVAQTPGSSAAELARITGLGAQSVGNILVVLEHAGLVLRGDVVRGRRGQPATPIHPNPDGAFVLGCEVGWRHYHILLQNFTGTVLGEHRRDYDYPDIDRVFSEVGSLAKLLVGLVPDSLRGRVLGLGLAMPSGFGCNMQLISGSDEQAQRWKEVDCAAAAKAVSGLEVLRLNDGNAACWAELSAHPAPRPIDLAYVHIGTFVGAGIVGQGRLWEGPSGNSADLGSMVVTQSDGRQQLVDMISSLYAFEARLIAGGRRVPAGSSVDWNWELLEPFAENWLEDSAHALAQALANTHAMMEFSVALVDGCLPRPVLRRLVEKIERRIDELPMPKSGRLKVEIGRTGAAAAARGAALRPLWRRYYSLDLHDLQRISDL